MRTLTTLFKFTIITFILFVGQTKDIILNTELPQLKTNTYLHRSDLLVNVTVGQNFVIGIPQFDIQKVPEDLKVYQISQQKFMNIFKTMQKHINNKIQNQTRKQVQNNIFQCTIKNPSMEIVKTLNVYTQKPSNKFTFTSQQAIIYIPIGTRQLLYTFDTANMELSVYHFTTQKLNFLSSVKINIQNGKKLAMAANSNQQKIYLFSNQGMWSIQTKTVLTNVEKHDDGFNKFKTNQYPIDQLYNGAYGYMFGLKRYQTVYLIPQDGDFQPSQHIINKYNDQRLIPQDIHISSSFIYILDLYQGIYIFRILGNGKVQQYDHIIWKSYGNIKFSVSRNSIFMKYATRQAQNIVQMYYDPQKHQAKLVRYYKNDQIITKIQTLNVPVYMSHQSYPVNEPLLFFVTDSSDVQIYPYNVDPRVINTPHNGVKMHVQGIIELIYLFQDYYIIATELNLLYVRIRIQKPELQCQMVQSTGHIFYQIQFSSNISSCQAYQNTLQHKQLYSSSCKLSANYMIYIDDPDLSRFQKAILYGVVFLVVASFIIGMMCLIQWRNNKLSLIGRIKDQIIKLRDRYRKMQPFTQQQPQNPNKNQVQFELPQALPIPDPNT